MDDLRCVRRYAKRRHGGRLTDPGGLERIEKSRAVGHLRKPFDRASVLAAIERAVGSIDAGRADEPEAGGLGSKPSDHRAHRDEGRES